MKYLKIMFILLISISLLCGCLGGGGYNDKAGASHEKGDIKVMISADSGITVKGENPIYVNEGETATFEIEVGSTSIITSVDGGTLSGNTVTLENVTRDTVIKITTIDLGYDTTVEYRYYFNGTDKDKSTLNGGSVAKAGTEVTVTAGGTSGAFIGWSLNGYSTDASTMISSEREYTFRLSPTLADSNGMIKIYANYKDPSCYYYDPNGGVITTGTALASNCDYYTVAKAENRLKITTSSVYRGVYESVHLFYDDGTFTRSGYVLAEFNTKADGSGTSYSLGSMYYPDPNSSEESVLYCIWKEETAASEFTYEIVQYDIPASTNATKASNWNTLGVKITSYSGNADTVVIPQMIGEYPVTAIGAGAFVNKDMTVLVLSKNLLAIEDGAFSGCSKLDTVYYSDAIYYITNNAFDSATYKNFKHLYVNATIAPRYANSDSGAFSVKLSRILSSMGDNRIITIAGSSTYQGFASAYMEALLGGEYRVVNFGTTRTTHGAIYLEAMKHLAAENDIILYAPENSTYMMGESELYWKTLRDMESMYNFYRYIDISNYTNVFSAFADLNQNYRYNRNATRYEDSYNRIMSTYGINEYGEYQQSNRGSLVSSYYDVYYITLNNRFKSKYEGEWENKEFQDANKNYADEQNVTWQTIDDPKLLALMNHAIDSAKSSGAKIYFSFCPMDADKVVEEARNSQWLAAYDALIKNIYHFDGVLGTCSDYIFAHKYFYDNAFHPNDIGRAYRTYRVYVDLCGILGKTPNGYLSVGTEFEGCIFESESNGNPLTSVDYLN